MERECMDIKMLDIDILSIAKEASQHKKKDNKVINATLGVLLDEEGTFLTLNSVDEALKDVDQTIIRNYLPQDGGELYKRSIYQYIFKTTLDDVNKTFYLASNWSSGGSGALYLAFKMHPGVILLPDIRWHEYDQIAANVNKEIATYSLFKENTLNLENIEVCFQQIKKPILFVLNDPAHNPTGYTLTIEDYEALLDIISQYEHVSLLIDIAYADFSNDYFKTMMPLFIERKQPVLLAFSGSKSYLVYGVRMGALIYLANTLEAMESFQQQTKFITGSTVGAPNSLSVILLSEIIHKSNLANEQQALKHILKERSDLFIEESKATNIAFYPYKEGFFITLKCQNPLLLTEHLKENKVYVIPTNQGIRIALSAISLKEIPKLIKLIKAAYEVC